MASRSAGFGIATMMVVVLFFCVLMAFAANPFSTSVAGARADGEGLNPLLQNFYMIIHPPSLYTGFVGCSIPFAYCIAALATGRLDAAWIQVGLGIHGAGHVGRVHDVAVRARGGGEPAPVHGGDNPGRAAGAYAIRILRSPGDAAGAAGRSEPGAALHGSLHWQDAPD